MITKSIKNCQYQNSTKRNEIEGVEQDIGKSFYNQREKERFRIPEKKTYIDNLQRSINSNFQRKREKKRKRGKKSS